LTDFTDTIVDVCTEAVRVAIAFVEVEEVRVILIRSILLNDGLDEWLNSNLEVSIVGTPILGLCAIVAEDTVTIVLLLHVEDVNRVHTSETKHQKGNVTT
jgi:hypothetical protein